MEEKTDNFASDIHTVDYLGPYEAMRTGAESLVNCFRRKRESLDGMWHFCADWYQTNLRAHWWEAVDDGSVPCDFDYESWDLMEVPACWNTQRAELRYFEGSGIYQRNFRFEKKPGERVVLFFEGAAYRAVVFLNGKQVCLHDGGSTPFSIDITDMVCTDNSLVVDVDGRRKTSRVPGENTDWFAYSGLYRSVYLVRVPEVFIKDMKLRLDGSGVMVCADLNACVDLPATLKIGDNRAELGFRNGHLEAFVDMPLELWSPDNPRLYDVSLRAGMDEVTDKTGFRSLEVMGHRVFLNGKAVMLKGVSVHEDDSVLGKTTTDEIIRKTIRTARDLGCNFLRLAHYPHSRRFAEIADEEGIMLWEEIPVYWTIEFGNRKTYQDAENQLCELIKRDFNRASVVIWGVGNENADSDERYFFMSSLAKAARALDPGRLVSAACLVNNRLMKITDRLADDLDIIGLNEYMGWYDPDYNHLQQILDNSKPDKPVIITEFGAGAKAGFKGGKGILFSEENQKDVYGKQFEIQSKCPYIAGVTAWTLFDFTSPRRCNSFQKGQNLKGLVASDRVSRKAVCKTVQDYYQTLQ